MLLIANSAAGRLSNDTKPKPRERPVSFSIMMRTEITLPNGMNSEYRSMLVMSFGMWNTNRLQPNGP